MTFDIPSLLYLHKILLNNSRGSDRNPGKFTESLVAVGRPQAPRDSLYFPPNDTLIASLMDNLLEYIGNDMDNLPFGVKLVSNLVNSRLTI